jgi:hypothetical protein
MSEREREEIERDNCIQHGWPDWQGWQDRELLWLLWL